MRFGWILLWLSALPAAILRCSPEAAAAWQERYLPRLRSVLAGFSAEFRFPLCDALALALLIVLFLAVLLRKRGILPFTAALLSFGLCLTWAAPCALNEPVRQARTAELFALCAQLSAEADALYPQERALRRDGIAEYAAQLCKSGIVPKAAALPGLMKALSLAGWWSPLTSEAVVDMSMGALNLPFALCHELMHAKGIAGEAQAHMEAYRVCMRGDGAFRYSGTMNALWHAMKRLRAQDTAAWERICERMSEGVRADFARMNGFSQPDVHFFSKIQDVCTDAYLFLTGSAHYDGFADLLAGEKIAHENAYLRLTQ